MNCGGCQGDGKYYDRQWGEMVLCDWCDGTGEYSGPGYRYYRKPRPLKVIGLK